MQNTKIKCMICAAGLPHCVWSCYKAVLGLFTALCFQILWAPRNHRSPKVSTSLLLFIFLPCYCWLADWKRSHTSLIHKELTPRLRLVMHLFWLQAEAWWERWGCGDSGGRDREEVDGWQDRRTEETDQGNAGDPQVHEHHFQQHEQNSSSYIMLAGMLLFSQETEKRGWTDSGRTSGLQTGRVMGRNPAVSVKQPSSVSDLFVLLTRLYFYCEIFDMRLS